MSAWLQGSRSNGNPTRGLNSLPQLITIAAIALFCSPAAFAANFANCILGKMPGTQNDVAANAVYQVCQGKHPGLFGSVVQGSGRGIFGFDSGAECTAKKAGDTRSQRAAVLIGVACRKLYDIPVDWKFFTPIN